MDILPELSQICLKIRYAENVLPPLFVAVRALHFPLPCEYRLKNKTIWYLTFGS